MEIGSHNIEHGLFLGPMAGVTDMTYRTLCQEKGCEVVCSEMVSAKAIYYNNAKTDQLIDIGPKENRVAIQLFGRDPQLIADMAKRIDQDRIFSFDVNMGCPVPKVVNNGEGSALMKEPKLIGDIVYALSRAVEKPVSIKIRSGFSQYSLNATEISKIAEANGASYVAIHGRTRDQYYSGQANWDVIQEAKAAVSIPIIGNGDIFSGKDLLKMKEYTGCDGFMVGRAAMGNPWIFEELKAALEGRTYEPPSLQDIVNTILRHAQMLTEHKGEYIAMREMRKHISWYTRGQKNATKLRHEINVIESMDSLNQLICKFFV